MNGNTKIKLNFTQDINAWFQDINAWVSFPLYLFIETYSSLFSKYVHTLLHQFTWRDLRALELPSLNFGLFCCLIYARCELEFWMGTDKTWPPKMAPQMALL